MMTTLLRLQDFDTSDSASFLYTLSAAYLDHTEQHTLTALCYLDSQVQEGGFVQLIASGYGEYIFGNPVADSLRRWRIKPIPKILDKAKALYEKHGEAIEKMADEQKDFDEIRKAFPDFEELDGDYYDVADEDLETAAAYVQANWDKFAKLSG